MRDRNLRVHLALGVLAGSFAAVAPLAAAERAVLLLCLAAVISAEAANTAVEAVVDLVSPDWNERARIAKDAAAAAVLVLAAGSVLVFAVIAGSRWDELVAARAALSAPAVGAVVAAIAAGVLPWRFPRPGGVDLALGGCSLAGLVAVGSAATARAGVVAAALCVAVAASAAWRTRGGREPAGHAGQG